MTGFTPETEACLACHPSQKDAGTMTDKTVDEAVERVRGYVESWDGFDDGTIISDELGPNPLTLGDLRALLSALELGSVGPAALPVVTADEPATPSDLDALGRAMLNLNADRIAWRKGNPRPALITLRDMDAIWAALSASTTDSGKVDHYRDDTALKFPTGEGGGL